jgi:23S rRNA pseudouridine1911/1915/1917 synthase
MPLPHHPSLPSILLEAVISPDLADQRLDKALAVILASHDHSLSRVRVQTLIAAGQVSLSGQVISSLRRKVKTDEIYKIHVPPPEQALPIAQEIALKIVHEDKDVIVINKPVGLVVHPAPGNRDGTLVNALLAHCKGTLSGIGGVSRPGIVHRLDKDTSGLMVVAKTDAAHQALARQFGDRTLNRTYQAIVWGTPHPHEGAVDAPIGRHARDRKKMGVTARGKSALTYYRVLETFGVASLVECRLATGRTHQIRVHFAHKKNPVVGDPVYGQKSRPAGKKEALLNAFPRQALHAIKLQFCHPRTGKTMRFKAALPKDMAALLRQLHA